MSIPPLVCNTPPPPDQCEDVTDNDEYDLQYNLSQDDEDEYGNGFDFQSYPTFNHFQSQDKDKENVVPKNIHPEITNKSQPLDQSPIHSDSVIDKTTESDLKCDKDIIEDLNLDVDSDQSSESIKGTDKSKAEGSSEYSSDNTTDISTLDPPIIHNIVDTSLESNESDPYLQSLNESKPVSQLEVIKEPKIPEAKESFSDSEPSDAQERFPDLKSNELNNQEMLSEDVDNDFDFDEFKFQSNNVSIPTTAIIDHCDNPWNDNDTCDDFGDFKANFDSGEDHQTMPEPSIIKTGEEKDTVQSFCTKVVKSDDEIINPDQNTDGDDFGDFDDFQSSSNGNKVEELSSQQPLYNLNTDNESQMVDSINKVIASMFDEDIEEPTTKFDGKVESMLCETWHYLLETDVRQPYMVNWNNSLGQQALLKSLCIDSRNILYGPKWTSNMPKYAANLCSAPLQPQKQASASTESSNPEKNASKPAESWSDPFKADGQESCSPENVSRTANAPAVVAAIRPSDLDVFEAAIAKKTEIHSAIIPVQPLRQINLPDTHIFTPSDSETPRSKTIHYDSGPPILLPQTLIDNPTLQEKPPVGQEESDDYWEFQDFKGASVSCAPDTRTSLPNKTTESSVPVPSVNQTYQTQILQPIKVEPITPTVLWPDPGEVKDTFEDFSDFVTNSNWNKDKTESLPTTQTQNDLHFVSEPTVFSNNTETHRTSTPDKVLQSNNSYDDEFDTFQSAALPSKSIQSEDSIEYHNNTKVTRAECLNIPPSPQVLPSTKIDLPLPGNKYDALSFMNTTSVTTTLNAAPKSSISQDTFAPSTSAKPDFSMTNSSVLTPGSHKSNILQPTLTSTQNHQKTGQILQPLSLESYSQINWPNPGLDFQDLSRFNPVETLQSLKSDLSTGGGSKSGTPVHTRKSPVKSQVLDDDWGDFVSSKPKPTSQSKKTPVFVDDDEWTDFVSSPSVKPQNGLNTISLNVHTNLSMQMSSQNKAPVKNNTLPLDIPSLNYITSKSTNNKSYNDRHFQNL